MSQATDDVLEKVVQWFAQSGKSLGFAESCTGGLLSSLITSQPGVSSFFQGAIISYSAELKHEKLGVPMPIIKAMGEVSLPVAKHMARGTRTALNVDWAVGITGIAGPTGGTVDKPVGTVCFAVSGPGFERQERVLIKGKDRKAIQKATAEQALQLLYACITA